MSTSIVFIDSRVANYQTFIDGFTQPTEVFLLTPESDGVEQIVTQLQARTGIDALHIISQGSVGALYLDNMALSQENISDYSAQLAAIGASLTETGDILLYGANVAQGDAGQTFIGQLAKLVGVDVAASDDLTEAAESRGYWMLEKSVGAVKTLTMPVNTLDTFFVHLDDARYDDGITANVFDSSSCLNYVLDMKRTSFGVPIELGFSAGGF
jgi:hypothetical protein